MKHARLLVKPRSRLVFAYCSLLNYPSTVLSQLRLQPLETSAVREGYLL